MGRLTSNKEVSEMSMIELAHNSCYAKDCKARYRDYDTDIDARELTIKLLDKFAGVPNEFTCDEDFEDFMLDSLLHGMDNIQGLIAIFYQNLWAMADLRERLKEYEDLEEQGKLPKLPCAVGDAVWCVQINSGGGRVPNWAEIFKSEFALGMYDDFRKTVFLSREEAEAALQNIGKDEQGR